MARRTTIQTRKWSMYQMPRNGLFFQLSVSESIVIRLFMLPFSYFDMQLGLVSKYNKY